MDVEELDADEGDLDIHGNGAVVKRVLKEAPEAEVEYGRPRIGDRVTISYEGRVEGCGHVLKKAHSSVLTALPRRASDVDAC